MNELESAEIRQWMVEATLALMNGADLMNLTQLRQWTGVRGLIETAPLTDEENAELMKRYKAPGYEMKTYADVISEIRLGVTSYRERLESRWPTPSPKHCLMFAVAAAARAIEEYLKPIPEYARNLFALEEVADCLMMLVLCGFEYMPTDTSDIINHRGVSKSELITLNHYIADLNHYIADLNHYIAESIARFSLHEEAHYEFDKIFSASMRSAISILGPEAAAHVKKQIRRIADKHAIMTNLCSLDIGTAIELDITPSHYTADIMGMSKCGDCGSVWWESFNVVAWVMNPDGNGYDDIAMSTMPGQMERHSPTCVVYTEEI